MDGQRGRPSGVMRLDLLKVVGSSPDFLARPDAVSLARAASRSMAVQIWLCVNMVMAPRLLGTRGRGFRPIRSLSRNYSLELPPSSNTFLQTSRGKAALE